MDAEDPRYTYNRFGMKGSRVGQAVVDILSKDQPNITVGEIIDEYSPDFVKHFEEAMETGTAKYKSPFYILVFSGKEMWATNIMRNWFVPRQTAPLALDLVYEYPNKTKTLYLVDGYKGDIKLLWSIPGIEECKSVLNNPLAYHPDLVEWIDKCFKGTLDQASYTFDNQ